MGRSEAKTLVNLYVGYRFTIDRGEIGDINV